jgi:hypothetical protein
MELTRGLVWAGTTAEEFIGQMIDEIPDWWDI